MNGGKKHALRARNGRQIHEGYYGEKWETLSAAVIAGTNTVLWRNREANRLHKWFTNENWSATRFEGWIDPNSQEAIDLEKTFNLDLNNEGIINGVTSANNLDNNLSTSAPLSVHAVHDAPIYLGEQALLVVG